MDICDPEILKAEKYGSRDYSVGKKARCSVCGGMAFEEDLLCDAGGNLLCSKDCKEKKFEDGRREAKNDKTRTYADLPS